MNRFRSFLLISATACSFALTGCESDSEKAERYFQSGMTLLEEGDVDRALIEFRNVFKYDGFHKEARQTYARLIREQGNTQESYSQYLRLVEQYPDTIEARVALAEMAITQNNWKEAERHGKAAIQLAPDQQDVQAIETSLSYRDAAIARDTEAQDKYAQRAAELLEKQRSDGQPDNKALVSLIIDHQIRNSTSEEALAAVDTALARDPEAENLNILRAQLLAKTGDIENTGKQLEKMITLFPENKEIKQAMINWYLVQRDIDGAEAFLRQEAGPDTGPTEGHVNVVKLLQANRGQQAARTELERLIASNPGTESGRLYNSMLAAMDFQEGKRDEAIEQLRSDIAASDAGEQKNRLQIILARMLNAIDQQDEAKSLIEEVLVADSTNVDALKIKGSWLIQQDQPGQAIVALRTALSQNPRDAETLTLMAQAHERDGDTALVGERLALAVEVSGNAPREAMRYASFLLGQERRQVATNVLEDARRRSPNDIDLLLMLANIRLSDSEWSLAENIVSSLRKIDTDEARRIATELQARILQAQNRTDDSLAVLEEQILDNASDLEKTRAIVMIVQSQIRSGKQEAAREYLDTAMAENPDNANLQLLDASLHAMMGNNDSAESGYRALVEQFPQSPLPARMLAGLLASSDRLEEASDVLAKALEQMPGEANLMGVQASVLEQLGKIDEAIDTYEALYKINSGNPVIANNLASLITNHRDDEESLRRAAGIVRRLRGTDVPAFQDTYGWIAYRRGNLDEALQYLEPAAKALETDPIVQYHLGMTYAKIGRVNDAREVLERALELAGENPPAPLEKARETLDQLEKGTGTSDN